MSTMFLPLVSTISFLMALVALSMQYKHLLSMLLSLEAATMSIFFLAFSKTNFISYNGEVALIFITIGACEASLGLSVLVSVIRGQGNDYVSSLATQKC